MKDRELLSLYLARKKDRAQATTRRRKQREATPLPVGDLLNDFFGKDPRALRRLEESRALLAWERFVGEVAARVCVAQRIRGNTLIVRVPDPLWMQQLSLLKQELLAKYREAFPRLRLNDIFFTRR